MFTLVYASKATEPFSMEEVLDLLRHSREKNALQGITGLLLYKQGAFIQALEGEEGAVRALYAHICEDSRHHDVLTLVAIPIAQRQFTDWLMGFKDLDAASLGPIEGHNLGLPVPPSSEELSWQGSIASSLLATFQQGHAPERAVSESALSDGPDC